MFHRLTEAVIDLLRDVLDMVCFVLSLVVFTAMLLPFFAWIIVKTLLEICYGKTKPGN